MPVEAIRSIAATSAKVPAGPLRAPAMPLRAVPQGLPEAAFAKLCGACPVPASSGKTSRHRLNRGGHRQANAAPHRVVVVRMRTHQPTVGYVRRRTAEGKSKREIIRCLKRFVARESFGYLCRAPRAAGPEQMAA